MKRKFLSFLLILVFWLSFGLNSSLAAQVDDNSNVVFEDPNVMKEVLYVLRDGTNLFDPSKAITKEQIAAGYEPTVGDMKNIKNLRVGPLFDADFNLVNATSIKGLETAVNVEDLHLSSLHAPDIALIENLTKVTKLYLKSNDLTDLSIIRNMTQMKDLNVTSNGLTSLSGLENFTELEKLTATDNQITDISALAGMTKLKGLYLDNNKISDISSLEKLEDLVVLRMSGNVIKSLDGIGKKPNLEEFQMNGAYTGPNDAPDPSGNTLTDISALKDMKSLKTLYLQDLVYISDISPLADLTNLQTLVLRGNSIEDISPLKNLTKIRTLYLYKNKVKDISALANMTEMRVLNFAVNQVEDISVLANMTKLNDIKGYLNKISDFSPLANICAETVNFTQNKILDLSVLKTLGENGACGFYVLDRQETDLEAEVISKTESNDNVEFTIKNPVKLADGQKISIDGNTELDPSISEYFEIGDAVDLYNAAVKENNSKGIEVISDGENIKVTIAKDLYKQGMTVRVPFSSLGTIVSDAMPFELYGTYSGIINFGFETPVYTISLDDGFGNIIEVEAKNGLLSQVIEDPVRRGYIFMGWYLNGQKVDLSKPFSGDVKLEAKWARKPNDSNISDGSGDNITEPNVKDNRISGQDRLETSIKLSEKSFDKAKTVVLASKEIYADALVSSALAAAYDGPVLLSNKDGLSAGLVAELKRLGVEELVLVGGENTLSKDLEKDIEAKGYEYQRLAGEDRYETSVLIYKKLKEITKLDGEVILASGEGFTDALSAGSLAAKEVKPILLTRKSALPQGVKKLVDTELDKIIIVGGPNSVSQDIEEKELTNESVTRLSGMDRYATSVEVAKYAYKDAKEAILVSGEIFPDALVASSLSRVKKAPLVLTSKNAMPSVVSEYVKGMNLTLVGGPASLTDDILN